MSTEIETLARSFHSPNWIAEFHARIPSETPVVSGADITYLLDNARLNLEKRRAGHATNWLALALRLNAMETLRRVRRTGLLRSSKYGYDGELVARVLNPIVENAATVGSQDSTKGYFSSVLTLLQLAAAVQDVHREIVRRLRDRRRAALKSLVAVVDARFLMTQKPDRSRSSDDPRFYSAEEYAEALSLLVHLFGKFVGIGDQHFNLLDESGITAGEYDGLLIEASKIKAFNEAELLVDVFSFNASREGCTVRLAPRDSLLEQSIRLGYIQVELQQIVTHVNASQDDGVRDRPSLSELVQRVFESHGHTLMVEIKNPMRRVVLRMPDAPELFRPFSEDHLYAEDVVYLEMTAREQYCRPDKLLSFEVSGGLKMLDVLKVQRLTNFIGGLMAERLLPLIRSGDPIGHRSLIPVFEVGQFVRLLAKSVGDQAAAEFMRCVSYDWSAQDKVFDIQYQPVIRGQKFALIPMNILRNSNLMRNLLFMHAEKGKAEDPDSKFSMQELLYSAMKERFGHVAENVKFKVAGQHLEADVLAVVGNALLVIECKSSFHPCNLHELRTSYDHVLKAADQLDRLKSVLAVQEVVRPLMRRLAWGDVEYDQILGCIVTANRMFSGYVIRGNPVRQAYEMINVIQDGTIRVGPDTLRVWEREEFAPDDLIRYLAGMTTHQDLFASMEPRDITFRIGNFEMTQATFILNGERIMDLARARYGVVGVDDVESPLS